MVLTELLSRIPVLEIHGEQNREISGLVFDSRKAAEGTLYIAVKGTVADGHTYIASSVEKGAAAIVCEELPETLDENVTYIQVKDSSKALGHLASNFYGNPSQKLKLIGVTGTNGKTSVSTLLFDVFSNLGYDSALLSTVEIRIGEKVIPATHTTPDIITINRILAEALEDGCEFAFMEVSSHGIAQNRIEGLHFTVAGFTNLTHDHLDYHKTFDEYLKTKKRFFDGLPETAVAITNADDKNGSVMLQNTRALKKTYAMKTMADYHGKLLEVDFNGMLLNFNGKRILDYPYRKVQRL
ncbi:UDP-N-acetylmuramyl-tripeptide synthetase [Chryseobacterium sp. SORGH_AS1175]|nr:UDP-N-acetylmuramyl-tripeptide synthetase [Chryseobacterium sp. SORGH_AS_1175]